MSDGGERIEQMDRTDPDVREAIQDARALVTARMESTEGVPAVDLDAIVNEMARKALAAEVPHRAIVAQLTSLASLAGLALGLAANFLLSEDTSDEIRLQARADVRAQVFLFLEDGTWF